MASAKGSNSTPNELYQSLDYVNRHLPPSSASWKDILSSDKEGAYYGRYASLYHTLEPSVVPQLEQAILYGDLRAFQLSTELFDKIPKDLKHHPIIALEHAQILWRQWSLLECRKVLEAALAWREHQDTVGVYDHGIYILLRIFLGKLVVFTKGDFTQARDSMKETRTWLTGLPISKYSDIEV